MRHASFGYCCCCDLVLCCLQYLRSLGTCRRKITASIIVYVSCSPLAVGAADAQEAPTCSNPQNKQGEQHLLVETINPKSAPTFSANRIRPEETATIFTELDLACSNRYSANPEITCNDRPASVQLIRATLAGGIVFCVYARHKAKNPIYFHT